MINEPVEQSRRPFDEVGELKKRKEFSTREVGLNHPDTHAFVRINDSGEIEIFAAPGIGLVISPSTRSISFFADSVKFYTREDDGLKWNNMSFNPSSDIYNEPTFIKTNEFQNNPAFYKINHYLNNLDQLDDPETVSPVTIGNEGGSSIVPGQENNFVTPAVEPELNEADELLLQEYQKTHTEFELSMLKHMLRNGYTFFEAVKKVEEKDYQIANNNEDYY